MATSDRRYHVRAVLLGNSTAVFVESIVVFTLVWQFSATYFGLVDLISTPRLVATTIYDLVISGEVVQPLVLTLRRSALALLIAIVLGTIFGVMVGVGDFWKRTFEDYILTGIAFPPLLGAVLAAIFFGITPTTAIVAGGLLAFPYLSQNVAKAVENIDFELVEMSDSFGVSRIRFVRRVILKSILPEWFAGLRYTFAVAWKIVTVAEVLAVGSGVGYQISRALARLSMKGVLAWTFIFAAIILMIEYGILQQIEKRVFEWRQEATIIGGVA